MLKKRSFWIGIGSGLVIGAVLLQMMTIGAKSTQSPTPESELADVESIRTHAERHGYELIDRDINWLSEEEHEQKLAEAVSDALESVEPVETIKVEKSIYVVPGMSSSHVADMLIALSVIDDKAAFVDELKDRNLTAKIRSGVKKFDEEMTLDEVIERLISK